MICLHRNRTYTLSLERNGPGDTWTRRRQSCETVKATIRLMANSGPPFRNDSLVIIDETTGTSQYIHW